MNEDLNLWEKQAIIEELKKCQKELEKYKKVVEFIQTCHTTELVKKYMEAVLK